ncbi:acetylxylan esterase [Geminisphaera colitermitum]|uniref:acetylxylan esterase n=1 Tax=Geminisphaera colitermitum TaxID=1148786 RepID=UPI000158C83A|nr:acetylxylan esterase [Geminisphaera colitermitum]
MIRNPIKTRIGSILLFTSAFAFGAVTSLAGDLLFTGKTREAKAFYAPGEKMTFEVRLEKDGKPVIGTPLAWTRTGDDGLTEKGKDVSGSKPLLVTTSAAKPGFVHIVVTALDENGQPSRMDDQRKTAIAFNGGAGVMPEKLQSIPEPADFDAWWAAQKAALAKVPLKVLEQKPLPPLKECPNVETFDVKIACAGVGGGEGKPVSGYFSKTRNAAPKSAVAIVYFHGYGVRSSSRRDVAANNPARPAIALDINAHGIENGKPAEFYTNLKNTTLKGYAFNRRENEKPETAYFYGMAMRVLRALEFIKAQPEWDGKHLEVNGGSQGGFQALLAAGLDAGVTRCVVKKPWGCDLGGVTLGRLKGWRPDYTRALDYFDPVNHAKRIRATTSILSGLGDYTCPPSGITVLYNNIPDTTHKNIEYRQGVTHPFDGNDAPWVQKFTAKN